MILHVLYRIDGELYDEAIEAPDYDTALAQAHDLPGQLLAVRVDRDAFSGA